MSNILTLTNITKSYRNNKVINNVSFSVPKGEVIGLVGPNGAGKTTLMRIIMGLITKFEGEVRFDIEKQPLQHIKRIGGLIEYPSFYPHMSGMDNLIYFAAISGGYDRDNVSSVVHLLGIEGFVHKKVKRYSLGMKQRLGIAQALVNNPKLLILDEPTNGLDPSGILDFREIVKKAAKERGMSVFVSSHILSEVQHLCDRVAFINGGEIKSVEKINEDGLATEKETLVVVTTADDKAMNLMKDLKFVNSINVFDDQVVVSIPKGYSPKLVQQLVKEDIEIVEVYKRHKGLEQRYMELVEGGVR